MYNMKDNPSYVITLLLASLPTGWIGLHHMYVGNYRRFGLYVILIWTLIPVVFSYIDVFLLLRRGQDSFIEKHHTDKSKEEYHLKKVAQNNPQAVDDEVLSKILNDSIEDIEKENYSEHTNENNEESENISDEDSEDSEDDNYIKEPDYSDYYGEWE